MQIDQDLLIPLEGLPLDIIFPDELNHLLLSTAAISVKHNNL